MGFGEGKNGGFVRQVHDTLVHSIAIAMATAVAKIRIKQIQGIALIGKVVPCPVMALPLLLLDRVPGPRIASGEFALVMAHRTIVLASLDR